MFSLFHIHRYGSALCHAGEGIYISFEAAAGMNGFNCCEDCRRRYLNLAKMMEKSPTSSDRNVELNLKPETFLTF